MNTNLSNQIKKTNEFRNGLAWEIKGIKKKWRMQDEEKRELLKTLSKEEVAVIEKRRIEKASVEARNIMDEKRNTSEYIENKEHYTEHKEIAKKLSELMNIPWKEAWDVVKNLDVITKKNEWFMERFIHSMTNLVNGETSLAKKIEKTRKEKEGLETKIKQIQWKWEVSQKDKEELLKILGEDELGIINQIRSKKTWEELEKFLEKEKERKEKLEKEYTEQQALTNTISELLDISENEVLSVLQHLNIKWEKDEKTKKNRTSNEQKTPKENTLKKQFEKTLSSIQDNKKKILIAASIILALGLWYKYWKEHIQDKNEARQEQAKAENKIMSIDTLIFPGYKEKNDTMTVKKFMEKTGTKMDAKTLTILPYPWEKLNEYSYIDGHYIKDKNQVIFYYNWGWQERTITIDWADPKTFVSLNGWFATDKYAKDKNGVYKITFDITQTSPISTQAIGLKLVKLEDVDPATFTII